MNSKENPRILFFNTSGDIGGGEISLVNLLLLLNHKPYEITVVCPDGAYTQILRKNHVRTWPVQVNLLKPIRLKFFRNQLYLFNPFSIIYNIMLVVLNGFRLHKIIRSIRPQIIHANTLEAIGIILLPSLISRVSMIWHIRILPRMNSPTNKLYINILSRFMKRIIAVSKAVKDRLGHLGVPLNKIEVIYNPIDTDTFRPDDKYKCRKMLNLPRNPILVGSYGRLNSDKGFEIFLKAAAIIKKKFNRTCFLIAGKEWEKNYRSKLISLSEELGLSENFILLDWQENARALICSVDILLLLPLEYEAFPRILAEGMACEIPVIGSNVGGITELIEHGRDGLIVPPDNALSVADAVCTLLEDKKLAIRLAKNGRHKVRTMLQRNQHVLKIEQIYTELT